MPLWYLEISLVHAFLFVVWLGFCCSLMCTMECEWPATTTTDCHGTKKKTVIGDVKFDFFSPGFRALVGLLKGHFAKKAQCWSIFGRIFGYLWHCELKFCGITVPISTRILAHYFFVQPIRLFFLSNFWSFCEKAETLGQFNLLQKALLERNSVFSTVGSHGLWVILDFVTDDFTGENQL